MAKMDWGSALKYGVLGAGGLLGPKLLAMVPAATDMLAKIPMWGTPLMEGVTLGAIVLTGASIGVVNELVYNK